MAFGAYAFGVIVAARGFPWTTGLAGLALVAALTAALRPSRAVRELAFVVCAAAGIGLLSASTALWRVEHRSFATLDGRHIVVEAIALERPRPSGNGVSVRVRIERVQSPGSRAATDLVGAGALVELPGDLEHAALAGRLLRLRARLDMPAGVRNEGEASERDTLGEQGVAVVLTVHRAADIFDLGASRDWRARLARVRVRAAAAVESRLPPLEATVLEGILWGDRGNLPATMRQEFSDTGTVHVLTTAGLHLGIMAALVAGLLSFLPIPRPARVALTLGAAWGYAALAGMHLPTLRAATMLTAGAIAYEAGRGRSPSAALAAAAFAVGLPHPLAILTPSFSMSFACVGGIALLSPALGACGLREGEGCPRFVAELARTSIAVQLALWPLQALYFNAFTPYAIAANMVVVPLVGLVMAAGTAYASTALWFPPLAAPLSNVCWWALAFVIGAVEKIATLPHAHIDVPPPSHAFIILYWAGLAAFAWAAHKQLEWKRAAPWAIGASLALALVYCAPGIAAALDPRLRFDAIDVGQADCLLIRAPGMHAMLVDGGGRLERVGSTSVVAQPIGDRIAARTVLPFLLRHWVLQLDAVVLTHPHGDHAGGLPLILTRERVGVLYDSAQLYSGPAYQRALDAARERHVPWLRAQRGVTFQLGPSARVKILAPELPLITGTASDINNNSVVLRIEFGKTAILLTGDAQSEAEARLLSHGGADVRADVLKVGHHGSAYSSTPDFLAAVRPKIAIISCGRHNVFGHPSPQTLAALQDAGADVFRTDLNGGIALLSNGSAISVLR